MQAFIRAFFFLGYGEVTIKGQQILHKQINTLEDSFVRHILFTLLNSNMNCCSF